jgi:uncharacterized YceG family protein
VTPRFGRSEEDRQRTAADREAARLERERRRAEREGRPPPDEAPAADEAAAPEPPEPDEPDLARFAPDDPEPDPGRTAPDQPDNHWEPFAHEPDPEPIPSQPERGGAEPPAPDEPEPEPEPPAARGREAWEPPEQDPQATQPLEPVGAARPRRTVSLPRPQTDEALGHHTDSWERPIGTVRKSRADYQPQPGAPGMPPHRNIGGVVKRRRVWLRRLIALLAIMIVAGIAVFVVLLYQPFHGKGYDAVVVKIPPGSSAGDIGDLLAKNDVVDSGFFFAVRARLGGDRGKLRAGTYTLKRSMAYGDALAVLTAAPTAAPTIDVTLPEGPSRRELAPRVKAAGVRGNYITASERSSLLNPRSYGAPKGTKGLEGFLFPDTYQLRSRTATAKELVNNQLRTFKGEFAKVDLKRAKRRNLSRYDVLIIASMIEREAQVAKDRALISAVIYNRLRRGMALGIDATLRYRLNNWSRPLKQSELNLNSDYNTRKAPGLPPTPIGNPGLASLQAAASPASAKYLFYVVKPCGNGAHAFSSTDAQFQKDVDAYNRARAKRGGKDPSHC